jgi:hypothetical protein
MQLTVEELGDVVVECLDHKPCNFVKSKPRSIISLLILEMQLSGRCWMKTLVALLSNPCPDIDTLNPV